MMRAVFSTMPPATHSVIPLQCTREELDRGHSLGKALKKLLIFSVGPPLDQLLRALCLFFHKFHSV